MELTNDRRLRLDASDRKLIRAIAAEEAAEIVSIEFIRECAVNVRNGSATHVYADIMRVMFDHFLAEAEALGRSARLQGGKACGCRPEGAAAACLRRETGDGPMSGSSSFRGCDESSREPHASVARGAVGARCRSTSAARRCAGSTHRRPPSPSRIDLRPRKTVTPLRDRSEHPWPWPVPRHDGRHAGTRIRTGDLPLTRRLLYQLSYAGTGRAF